MLEMVLHIPVIPVTVAWHVSDEDDSLVATVPMTVAVCIIVSATVPVVAAVTSAVAATVDDTVSATETVGAAVAAAASALAITGRDQVKNMLDMKDFYICTYNVNFTGKSIAGSISRFGCAQTFSPMVAGSIIGMPNGCKFYSSMKLLLP